MTSTIWRSNGYPSYFIVCTASTIISVKGLASDGCILVMREVRATSNSNSLSTSSFFTLNVSKKANVSFLAISIPSTRTLGCTPSPKYLSAYLKSSPIKRTFDVVPSPTISSYAVAALPIIAAVGC